MLRINSCPSVQLFPAALVALSLLAPGVALAQAGPSESATARADAAFDEGRELFEQGRFKEACEKFELSMQLDPSPGTLLNLGNCYEPQGDLLKALGVFERALAEAQKAGDRKKRAAWSDAARERIASLSKRIPELTIEAAEPGIAVQLDGKPYATLGQPQRQNPGRHHVEVSAPGKRTFTTSFELLDGQPLTLRLPPLEAIEATPDPIAPAPALASPPAQDLDSERRFGIWPWIAGGTGAALLGTSLVTGLMASSKAAQLEDECPEMVCTDESLESVRDSAMTLGITTDILWITGALAVATGVTLFVLDYGKAEPGAALEAGCFGGGCGFAASGRF
jgi:hypothetical protein